MQARAGADASVADAIFPVGISLPRSIGAADFSLTHAPVETGCRVLAATGDIHLSVELIP